MYNMYKYITINHQLRKCTIYEDSPDPSSPGVLSVQGE